MIKIKESSDNIKKEAKKIGNEFFINSKIIEILLRRNFSVEDIKDFLFSDYKFLKQDFFTNLKESGEFVKKAILNGKKICIYGDYDVDGITATSILSLTLKKINKIKQNFSWFYFIPKRDEGYGLSRESLDEIKKRGAEVVITVDCGISAVEEVLYAKSIGLEILITDHHDLKEIIPDCLCLNPKMSDHVDIHTLSGAGVAFFLSYELLKSDINFTNQLLEITALGTIADVVPINKINRDIIRIGLEKMGSTSIIGLRKLFSKLFMDFNDRVYTSQDIGFFVGPCFNALGRMDFEKRGEETSGAEIGVKLLLTESLTEADELSDKMILANKERKVFQESIYQKVLNEIGDTHDGNIILCKSKDYHHGVMGIVAGKICEKFNKPTGIFQEIDGVYKGSFRSVEGVNIFEALQECDFLMEKFGGHSMASGASVKVENFSDFENALKIAIQKQVEINDVSFDKEIEVDFELSPDEINMDFCHAIDRLEPFGNNNPEPLFLIKDLTVKDLKLIGEKKNHVSLMGYKKIGSLNKSLKFVMFNTTDDIYTELEETEKIDIVCAIKKNTFKGVSSPQGLIKYYFPLEKNTNTLSFLDMLQLGAVEHEIFSVIRDKNINRLNEIILEESDLSFILNGYGDTPLIFAVKENDLEIVKLLIKSVNLDLKNNENDSALMIALRNNFFDIARLLVFNHATISKDLLEIDMSIESKTFINQF